MRQTERRWVRGQREREFGEGEEPDMKRGKGTREGDGALMERGRKGWTAFKRGKYRVNTSAQKTKLGQEMESNVE